MSGATRGVQWLGWMAMIFVITFAFTPAVARAQKPGAGEKVAAKPAAKLAAKIDGLAVYPGSPPAKPHGELLQLVEALRQSPALPRFASEDAYLKWLNKSYRALSAKRTQRSRRATELLMQLSDQHPDRVLRAVATALLADAAYDWQTTVDEANPAAGQLGPVGLPLHAALAKKAARAADACVAAASEPEADPLYAPWSARCAELAATHRKALAGKCESLRGSGLQLDDCDGK